MRTLKDILDQHEYLEKIKPELTSFISSVDNYEDKLNLLLSLLFLGQEVSDMLGKQDFSQVPKILAQKWKGEIDKLDQFILESKNRFSSTIGQLEEEDILEKYKIPQEVVELRKTIEENLKELEELRKQTLYPE